MNNMYPILAIETTDELCSTALVLSESEYSELNVVGKHVHSQKLFPMIDHLLQTNGIQISQLKFIAVSEGPGSFTGLRIGIAAAKGIAVGANIPMLLVPTFEALAYKIANYIPIEQKFVIVRQASRDEIYFAKYVNSKMGLVSEIELSLLNKTKIGDKISMADLVISNLEKDDNNSYLATPNAMDIAIWANKFGKDLVTSDYDLLEPKYFKEFIIKEST